MAVIKIEAKKDTRCMQTICMIRGDRRTQILRFGVNRFDGGVDLSDLTWVIKTENAKGVEDVFEPEAVEISENRITVDWLVDGSVTDADGLAKYELNGLDATEDGKGVAWKGGTGTISMRADISPKFGETDGLTNIEKLILYVEGELQNVIDAGGAALDAAERANHAADAIQDYTAAVDRANAAAQRATDAAAAVEDLEGAVGRANTAATLANNSSQNAEMAASSAYDAAGRATEAAKNVENIEEATEAAYAAAEDARAAANVANTAGLPAAMIYGMRVKGETANASGNPVTCLADAGSLLQPVTVLEPQQEGSGDPYPAGGGRNLAPLYKDTTMNGVSFAVGDDNSVRVSGTASAQTTIFRETHLPVGSYILSGAAAGSISGSYDVYVALMEGETGDNGTIVARSYDGSNVTNFTLNAYSRIRVMIRLPAGAMDTSKVFYPMIRLASDTDTSYAPPSNIRPITGYDKLNLNAAGKNLLSLKNLTDTVTNRVNASIYDNEIDLSPNDGGVGFQQWYGKMTIPESWRGKTFTYSVQSSVNGSSASVLSKSFLIENDANGNEIGIAANLTVTPGVASSGSFVVKENTVSFTILFRADQYQMFPTGAHMWFGQIQLEESPVMTAYMPYQGKLHTVQIGQTVYGGKIDWLTGKLTKVWPAVALRDLTISYKGGDHNYFEINMPSDALATADFLCESYKNVGVLYYSSMPTTPTGCMGYYPQDRLWRLKDTRYTSVDELLAGNGDMKIAYKLATPVEIQLAPHIISAAAPEQTNTLYGDGVIEVEYVKPLHVSIEEHVAAAVAAAMNTEGE